MTYNIEDIRNKIICGESLEELKKFPSESIDMVVTSVPYYGLRSYLNDNHPDKPKEIGLEPTLDEYLNKLLAITKEIKRVMRDDATFYLNYGDSYASKGTLASRFYHGKNQGKHKLSDGNFAGRCRTSEIPAKCLVMQNYRLVLRMIEEQGFILRDIRIWAKKIWITKENKTIGSAMPQSVGDRPNFTYEPVFMLVKSQKYWYDQDAVRIPVTQEFDTPKQNNGEFNIPKYAKGSEFMRKYGEPWDRFGKNTNKFRKGRSGNDEKLGNRNFMPIKKTKIPEEQAESFGSPRARNYRQEKSKEQGMHTFYTHSRRNIRKPLEERMEDTKSEAGSLAYNVKKTLSEVRTGEKPYFSLGANPPNVMQINPEPFNMNIKTEYGILKENLNQEDKNMVMNELKKAKLIN